MDAAATDDVVQRGFAQTTVTFDATKDKSASTTLTKDGVTLKIGKGTLDNGKEYRWHGEDPKTLTISSTETITKIQFTCTANNASQHRSGYGISAPCREQEKDNLMEEKYHER